MSSNTGKVVCVTGASGYIASWIVKFLLQRGYIVDHLLKLDGAKERLLLFKADLLEEGSFDSAIEGCDGVFHTASPVNPIVKDPQMWYAFAKTSAEDAATKLLNENNKDFVVINPTMTIGPLLQPELNASAALILNLINEILSKSEQRHFQILVLDGVNVKDVANAHIQAYEIASARGRYCLVERVAHFSELTKILPDIYPTLQIPDKCEEDNPFVPTFQVSKEKAKSLGIEFIPLELSLKETVNSLKEKKFANIN
ncbi:hypothetical protein RJT34_31649 [Clitoria ternatea]|uniref:NAD-dependent epimerase/dehydratase domain-containing protein n=1 Tax=Clitoria ternatea TaxID=43366 RepID=A0AAN9EWT6_CLITE